MMKWAGLLPLVLVVSLWAPSDCFIVKPWLLDLFKPHIQDGDWAHFVNEFLNQGKREHLSPIDIEVSRTKRIKVPRLVFSTNTWGSKNIFLVENNGHYAKFSLIGPNKVLTLSGGPLKGVYQFENLHAHWHPTNNTDGTEHSINKRKYAMEFHAVYFNRRYRTFENAVGKKDGIAVCGFILEAVAGVENSALENLSNAVATVPDPEDKALVKYNVLRPFRQVALSEKYFHYSGTLTSDSPDPVKWIVFSTFIPISPHQVDNYRKMVDDKGQPMDNVRDQIQKRKMPVYYIDNSISNSLNKPTAT